MSASATVPCSGTCFLVFYPIRDAPEVNPLVAAMTLPMILEGIALHFFGTETKWFLIRSTKRIPGIRRSIYIDRTWHLHLKDFCRKG